jgi:hypothetical protein
MAQRNATSQQWRLKWSKICPGIIFGAFMKIQPMGIEIVAKLKTPNT